MRVEDLLDYYAYNYWANKKLLIAAAELPKKKFVAPAGQGQGVRGILVHIYDAERRWRLRCQEGKTPEKIDEETFPTVAELQEKWRLEEKAMLSFLVDMRSEELYRMVQYYDSEGPLQDVLWHLLVHIVNHGTEHRSRAAALLTELGQSPGSLDFWLFLRER